MSQRRRWHVYPDSSDLVAHAAEAILRAAAQAIAARGRFLVCLAGGTTPLKIYECLASARTEWKAWHIYFGDERCRPVGDAERNDEAAFETLLRRVPVPADQIFPMPAELGARSGATRYRDVIKDVDLFDVVLLGLGEDGHTASLFPGLWNPHEAADAVAVENAPKPPSDRISLSAARLSRARQVMFLVTGEAKRAAVHAWHGGENIPAAGIVPAAGVDIFIDAGAWPVDVA